MHQRGSWFLPHMQRCPSVQPSKFFGINNLWPCYLKYMTTNISKSKNLNDYQYLGMREGTGPTGF